jgi:hypothetical protein
MISQLHNYAQFLYNFSKSILRVFIQLKQLNFGILAIQVKRRRRTPLQADGASEASPHKDCTTQI